MTADEVIDAGFESTEARMAALRVTAKEVARLAVLPYPTYWRASRAVTKGRTARVKILRKIEAALTELENGQ